MLLLLVVGFACTSNDGPKDEPSSIEAEADPEAPATGSGSGDEPPSEPPPPENNVAAGDSTTDPPSAAPPPLTGPDDEVASEPAATDGIEAPSVADGGCRLTVNRALMAREVVDREPSGTSGPFAADGEPLYFFAEFDNRDGPETHVTLRWSHPDTEHEFTQTMSVGVSPAWRTWARHRIATSRVGAWKVEVLGDGGCRATAVEFQAR